MSLSLKMFALAMLVSTVLGCKDKAVTYANPPSSLVEQLEANPEKVRILYAEKLPLPENKSLLFQMQRLGLDSPYFTGTTFGYGIWISNKMKGNKLLIAHELIHVKQMEEVGLEEFTKKYLLQLAIFGYSEAPIEIEAYENAAGYL
ncbi:putative membrane lipoprotein lipid attachment site related protein [Vibrio cholerae]|nr:putative membrane lipoprotein lipid attachment site related protein [Vibrio cholerae]